MLNTVEAMCIAQMLDANGDAEIDQAQKAMRDELEEWIPLLLAAQEPDGYFQTRFTLGTARERSAATRRSVGTSGSAASTKATSPATSSRPASPITSRPAARTAALRRREETGRLLVRQHRPAPKKAWYDGHQEMEMALLPSRPLRRRSRGRREGPQVRRTRKIPSRLPRQSRAWQEGEYDQSHVAGTQQYAAVGHAVRAVYSYAAMADAAKVSGDVDYQSAVRSIWDNLVNRKYYVTGGVGSGETSEGFGGDYSLPVHAYCESCSGCGMLFFQHKMHALTGHAKYADLYEETLYNAILSDIDLAGENFTYTNSLDTDERALQVARLPLLRRQHPAHAPDAQRSGSIRSMRRRCCRHSGGRVPLVARLVGVERVRVREILAREIDVTEDRIVERLLIQVRVLRVAVERVHLVLEEEHPQPEHNSQ